MPTRALDFADRSVLSFSLEKRRGHRFQYHFCRSIQYKSDVTWSNSMTENRLYAVLSQGTQAGRVAIRGRGMVPCALRADRIYLLPRNRAYELFFPRGMHLLAFHFQALSLAGIDFFPDETPILVHPEPKPWVDLLRQVLPRIASVHGELSLRSLATSIAWSFADKVDPGGDVLDGLVRRFPQMFKVLEATPPGAVKIGALARAENRSTEALSKAFRRAAGFPLKDFLMKRALEALQRQLLHTQDSVRAIADALGFPTEDACSKFMKFHTGSSPSSWRKKQRNEIH